MDSTPDRAFVSVVIPARNEAPHIEDCLSALRTQTYPIELVEIIVADGGSTDGTADLVASAARTDSRIRVVENPSRKTASGLNAAIREARGDVILRMDGHAVPAATYVERCVDRLRTAAAWAVGGRMMKTSSTALGRAIAAASSSPFGVGDSAFHYAERARAVESVYLGCWPRWVFDRVGMFDEELVRNQDDELSYRIRQAGGTILFDPSIEVAYRPRESLGALFEQHRQYGFWKVRVFQKHPGSIRWRHLVPGLLAGVLATGILFPINRAASLPAAAAAAVYGMAAVFAASRVSARSPGVRIRNVVGAFGAMHLGYGIGLWQGLFRWLLARRSH